MELCKKQMMIDVVNYWRQIDPTSCQTPVEHLYLHDRQQGIYFIWSFARLIIMHSISIARAEVAREARVNRKIE